MRYVQAFSNLVDQANDRSGELELIRPTFNRNKTGLCEECEEEIPAPRRLAIPNVAHCLDCQRELEASRDAQVRVKAV